MSKELRVCVDRVLPLSKQYEAAQLAMEERASNAPNPGLLSDALETLVAPVEDSLVLLTKKKWANDRVLKVYFIDGPEWARAKAFTYMKRWSQHANIHFERTTERLASDCRVTFTEGGSWSYMGTDNLAISKDEPTMQFGWLLSVPDDDEEWRRVCVHEAGHLLDFAHEQSSPVGDISWNKEAVFSYYAGPPNNWSRRQVESQVFFKYSLLNTNYSEYDPKSIMHYAIPKAFVLDPNDAVGWNTSRSVLDKRTSALWYPKPTTNGLIDGLVRAYDVGSKV